MKNKRFKKALSVFLSILMLMSCWVWVAPTDASAAGNYYVRVYLNIYDGANSDGYGKAYSVVDDINSEFYGKPNEYKWDYGSSWNAFDNSDGYDGEVNMAGFTLFYDNDKKYKAYDLSADLVAATTTLGNNWTSMDDLTLENFAAWPNKVEKVYSFNLDSMPSSLFWINDENNAVNGETSFGIHKITVAESSTSQEHILWTGLSGSESYYECYYGTITPTGLITPWDDCPGEDTKTFYKDYTTSAVGTWIDPFNAGDYNVYPVNNYLSGGVSATFTVGSNGSQTNIDYIELGNTNNYYINFTNHSTQTATITALNSSNLVNSYSNNLTIAPGETKSFTLKKASMSGDGNYYNFCFKYTLNNVFEKNGTTPVEFYQAAYIGTWNTSDDSSVIGPPTTSEANSGFTVYNGADMDFMSQFMADTGIFETVSTTGNRTSDITFKYNYYLDNTDTKYTNWSQTGLRMYVKKWTYNVTIYFQPDTDDGGTMNLVGEIDNKDSASLSIADMVYSYSSASDSFKIPDSNNRPWARYNTPCIPQWGRASSMEWGTVTSNTTVAYFRFCGNLFKGSTTSSNPGIIRFTDMRWESTNNRAATFDGDINVYVFDKSQLRDCVRNLGGLGANWAPMRTRFNDAKWNAYESALQTAMQVLANQKTNQKAVTDAYNTLYSATEALKSTANLVNQVAEVTYTKRTADYNSAATDATNKYLIMPIGTETAVPSYDAYKHTTSGTVVAKQSSNLKTNFTQYETGINPIDYRYWKIDFAGVDKAVEEATELLDTPLDAYSDKYYEEIFDARTAISYFDRDADTWTPTYQSDVTDHLNELNALLAHNSTEAGAHEFIEDANGNYVIKFDETTHWYECGVCGYKYMHENHKTSATPDSNDANSHIVECTYVDNTSGNTCDFVMTEPHTFTNSELARPTLVDGAWKNGTYTYTCTCGKTKEEDAVRADYSELEEAIEALEGIKNDENLSDEAKTVIANTLTKADNLADDLVTAEQEQIDNLVKELQKVKADAEEAIKNKELGVEKITEATSGVKVQFIDSDGLGTIENVQLGEDDGFKIRVANGNADSNITITNIQGDGISETDDQTIESGKSVDFDVAMPTTAGIHEYTITYTIDGLRDAEGNDVVFTTKAYLYVKGEAYQPYHLMDETCNNGPATAKWEYSLESSVGDFAPVYNNKAPKAEFGNDNLVVDKDWVRPVYHKYDYEDNKCFAECTGTGDTPYVKGDAHAATYRYYIDTSLAPTWQEAGFKAVIAEGVESKYDYAVFNYIRLANNKAYLDSIKGDNKTFSVTVIPGASSNVPTKTWTATSTGDAALTVSDTSDIKDFFKDNEYLFGNYLDEAQTIYTAYTNFSGNIPQSTDAAKMMFSYRIGYNMAEDHFLGGVQAESTTMTTHLYITSYDKAALREAVANAEQAGFNSEYFDKEKYEAYENALKNAKEVLGKAETNQDEIDAATATLKNAIDNLNKADAEAKFILTVIHSIHENADKNSEATSTEYDYYLVNGDITPAQIDLTDMQINKKSDIANLTITEDTEYTYYYWYIDYSGVDDAIDAAEEFINNADDYSEEFIDDVTAKKEALEDILDNKDATTTPESQSEVDDAIKAVTDLTGHTHDYDDATCTEAQKCKICGATNGVANGHVWNDGTLTQRPTFVDSKWVDGYYTYTCDTCGTTKTEPAVRANYTAYDEAVAGLNELLKDTTLTDAAIAEINKVLADNKIIVNHVTADQDTVDNAAAALKVVLDKINGNKDAYQTPDSSAAKKAVEDAEALAGKIEMPQSDKDKINELRTELNDILGDMANDDNATAEEYQSRLEAVEEAAKVILEKYKDCTEGHVWGEGNLTQRPTFVDGKWADGYYIYTCDNCGTTKTEPAVRANYTAYDEAVAGLNELLKDTTLTDAAIAEINKVLADNKILDNHVTAEQDTVDNAAAALKVVLDKIANDTTGAYEKVNFTEYNAAVNAYESLKDNMSEADKNAVAEAMKSVTDANITGNTSKADGQDILDEATAKIVEINAKYGNCAAGNHTWGEPVLTKKPTATEQGEYTETCGICGAKQITKVDLANYGDFNTVVGQLQNLAKTENLTAEAANAIADALAKAEALDKNLPADVTTVNDKEIKGGQDKIDALVAELNKVVTDTNAAITDGSALKPDYANWEIAEGNYDALDKTNVKADIIAEVNGLKNTIADKQADKTLTQATATQDDINDATTRLNQIIEGISNGSLRDPDYSAVENKITEAKGNDNLNKDTQDKIKEIEEELQKIKDKTEPEANAKDDQPAVDALEGQLDKILKDIADNSAKAPDYTNWDIAEGTYDALDKTNISETLINEATGLKNTINTLKADPTANAKEDQATIDDATTRLNEIITEINGILSEKLNFNGYDDAHDEYEDLVAQYGDKIKDDVAGKVNALDTIVEGVREDETATKIEDQGTVDNAKTQLDTIINGIKDGSLRDPDYSAVEDKLEQANNATGLNQDTQSKIDAIENALAAIKGKTEPEANAKDDQPAVDALEDQLDEILKDIADGKVTAPDYTEWNAAEGTYDALDKTNISETLINEATGLKNTINTLKADPTANAKEDQATINNATTRLNEIITEINGILNEKPDFTGYDASHDEYEDLVTQSGDKIKDDVAGKVNALDTIVEGVRGDETATKIEDQGTVDNAKTQLDTIIDGIKDGSLRDPDYSAVEDKLEQANNAAGLNQDTQSKIDAIENALAAIKGKTEPEANAKDDQPAVDALEDQLDEILKDIADNSAKAPDYTNWDAAEDAYDEFTAEELQNVKTEILDEVTALKNTINTLKADPTANAKDDQKTVNDATARLNQIIEGINNGSLLNPDDGECKHTSTEYVVDNSNGDKLSTHSLKCTACGEILSTEACTFTTKTVEATCHSEGYTVYSCTVCSYGFRADFTKMVPHTYSNWQLVEISCTEVATMTRECIVEGCLAQESKPAKDENGKPVYGMHTLVVVEGKAATCLNDGYTDYTYCVVCNKRTDSTVLPATGHKDDNHNGNCDLCSRPMNPTGHCSCFCHGDSFFEKLLFRIINFFWKLFKINRNCDCGANHW